MPWHIGHPRGRNTTAGAHLRTVPAPAQPHACTPAFSRRPEPLPPPRAPSSSLRPHANHLGRSPMPRSSCLTRSQAESGSESLDFVAPASPPPHSAARIGRRRPAPPPHAPSLPWPPDPQSTTEIRSAYHCAQNRQIQIRRPSSLDTGSAWPFC